MNDNQLNAYADRIFTNVFCLDAKRKSREELTQIIKKTVIEVYSDAKSVGRRQILNHFKVEIQNIEGS